MADSTRLSGQNDSSAQPPAGFALFRLGFRPFFLFGALFGLLALVYFILVMSGADVPFPGVWDVISWHRHEMLFGFAGAIVAGFLLTAVPNWTGQPTPKGIALAGLFGLWLAGRIALFFSAGLPMVMVAVVDASFFLICAAAIAPALTKSRNRRNYFFLVLLALLSLGNTLTYMKDYADTGIQLALGIITLMMVIVGGRVIPFFTERRIGISVNRRLYLERAGALTVLAALGLAVFPVAEPITGAAFLIAALVNGCRLATWQGHRTLRIPLLWILHAGYAWIIIGFLCEAAWRLGLDIPPTIATHALTAGAMGTLILGMIARVSLGHSGRPLETGLAMNIAFISVTLAAVFRVFGIWLLPEHAMPFLHLSACLWALAFGLFVIVYTPVLLRPRLDGKDG